VSEQLEQPSDDIAALLGRATELKAAVEAARADGGKVAELETNFAEIRDKINDLQRVENERQSNAKADALMGQMEDFLRNQRTPSKAGVIGGGPVSSGTSDSNFFAALAQARSRDYQTQATGKARLEAMGSHYADVPSESKATLGDTDAAGGYLVPNNVVTDIELQAQPGRTVVDLFNVVNGIRGTGVDIPWEDTADARASIVAPGTTKENSNFIVGNYTATLYTLARIFDISNRLLRTSEGAAERLVRSKLAKAMARGEDYYALQGSGSSQPYGLLTALGTGGPYVTSHTAAQTTIAGNFASGIAKAAGAIADRGAVPDAVVLNSGNYWTVIASGDDDAGFYVNPSGGAYNFNAARTGVISAGPWGIRLAHTPNMPSDSLVVGEFSAADFYRGEGYRVDVSSEAGDRWDKNLTGFRGEEDIAFDARPYVYTGYFQRLTDVVA
jgi:HK97 family phage major capsid protein